MKRPFAGLALLLALSLPALLQPAYAQIAPTPDLQTVETAADETAEGRSIDEVLPRIDPDDIDPWEKFNRPMFRFNSFFDRVILRPSAVVYSRAVPRLARVGVNNFFNNLQQPITSLNLLLQGHPIKATASLGRFLMNSTLGIGGIFDPATEARIPPYDQDFGQTLHRWGWKKSRYVVLPLFGPGTVRESVGKGVTTTVSPISWLAEREGAEISILYGLSARARGLKADALFSSENGDAYLLMRDAYLQFRRCQLVDCSEELPDYLLPDYDFELPDVDAIRLRD